MGEGDDPVPDYYGDDGHKNDSVPSSRNNNNGKGDKNSQQWEDAKVSIEIEGEIKDTSSAKAGFANWCDHSIYDYLPVESPRRIYCRVKYLDDVAESSSDDTDFTRLYKT